MPNAPAGVIVGWPDSAASIPAGWTRVTALDGKYTVGAALGSSGALSGVASHHHSIPLHIHTNSHIHGLSGASASANPTDPTYQDEAGTGMARPQSHTHSVTGYTNPGSGSVENKGDTTSEMDNAPAFLGVIWIQSDGPTGLPEGAVAFHQQAQTGWTAVASGKYLAGVATGEDGGGEGGSDFSTHAHNSATAHWHSFTHYHTIYSSDSFTASSELASHITGAGLGDVKTTHRHGVTIASTSPSYGSARPTSAGAAGAFPPSVRLWALRNDTGGEVLPEGIIVAWMGASLPARWAICDGNGGTPNLVDRYPLGAASAEEVGTVVGATTHHHSVNSHEHTQAVPHTHVVTLSGVLVQDRCDALNPGTRGMYDHTHATGSMVTTGSSDALDPKTGMTTGEGSSLPPSVSVCFIMYLGGPPEDPAVCEDGECPDSDAPPCGPSRTEANSAWVGAAGGPSGGAPTNGFSGYVGGLPRSRWSGASVDLEVPRGLNIADGSGKVALKHPTTALGLSFASGQTQSGPVGWNWSHEYNVTLVRQSASVVDIQHEGGRWDRYEFAGSTWTPEEGRRACLVQNGDGTWAETTPYGVQYQFPATGGTYPATVRVSAIADANGNQTTFSYSGDNLASVLDSFGQRLTFSYDGSNRVQEVVDPAGARTTFSYDGSANLWSVQHPDGARVTYSYNANHDPVTIQLPPGLGQTTGPVTTLSYDASGRVCGVTDPAGRPVRTISYDPGNRRTVITDARGGIWTDTYAENGMPLTRQGPLGTSRANDWMERDATAFTDARGNRWTYSYDSLHRRIGMISPLLCAHSYEYNADNMPTVYVDPLGNRTTSMYDSHRNRIAEIHPDGGVVSYSYYPDAPYGRVQDVQDARGSYATYTYDARGNLETTLRPDDTVVTFTYNARNQLESTTDPLGHTTTSSYDVMGRLMEVEDPLGNRTAYVYDLLGRQVAVLDPLGSRVTTQYNALGQVEAQVDALDHCVSYSYDANGNRISTMDPLGKVTTFVYDARDRLVAEVNPLGATTSYDYDENGNQRAVIDALGKRTTTSYDAVNRPTAMADPLNHTVETIYYTTGWVKATVDQLGNRTTYSYDAMGRQREVLDALGNRTTYSYDLNGNQIEMQDARGNRWRSVYDCMNRLTASVDPSGAVTTHSYDAAGRRTATLNPGGGRTSYSYDAVNRQIAVSRDEG
jgi:YD repeat-containing protein